MNIIYRKVIPLPIGKLMLEEQNGCLIRIAFEHDIPSDIVLSETPLLNQTADELKEYFSGKRREFDLPLAPVGTDFQKQVWSALCKIPYGETMTYGQIAALISNPKASRAVGMANHNNPIPIIIPCHRVIGANGKLIGYAGGLGIKETLLKLEK